MTSSRFRSTNQEYRGVEQWSLCDGTARLRLNGFKTRGATACGKKMRKGLATLEVGEAEAPQKCVVQGLQKEKASGS